MQYREELTHKANAMHYAQASKREQFACRGNTDAIETVLSHASDTLVKPARSLKRRCLPPKWLSIRSRLQGDARATSFRLAGLCKPRVAAETMVRSTRPRCGS